MCPFFLSFYVSLPDFNLQMFYLSMPFDLSYFGFCFVVITIVLVRRRRFVREKRIEHDINILKITVHRLSIFRRANPLHFTRLFSDEGKFEYIGYPNISRTQRSKVIEQRSGMASCPWHVRNILLKT
jgi:hypothetical protein